MELVCPDRAIEHETCDTSRQLKAKAPLPQGNGAFDFLLPLLYCVNRLVGGLLGRICGGLAGILHGNGSLLAALFGVLDGYCCALFGSVVGRDAGVADTLGSAFCALDGRFVGPLDGLLGAVLGLAHHGLGGLVDALNEAAAGVNHVLRIESGTERESCNYDCNPKLLHYQSPRLHRAVLSAEHTSELQSPIYIV